jgi:hypothetical protein
MKVGLLSADNSPTFIQEATRERFTDPRSGSGYDCQGTGHIFSSET